MIWAFPRCALSSLGNGGGGDRGDEGHVAVNFGVAFGEDANCSQIIFPQACRRDGQAASRAPPRQRPKTVSGQQLLKNVKL